jgi:HD-like signal output (HDOD) protein
MHIVMKALNTLQEKIKRISNLPTLPEIVMRVMRIINNPKTSSREVATAVEQDVALSAKIIRLANSAFYGVPKSVTSINGAIVVLGFKVINTIVLSLTVFDMFPCDKRSTLFNRTAFWRHCTSCALISRYLAQRMSAFFPFEAEEAFCAGLLHDIGKVVMEQYLHEDFHKALRHAKARGIPLYQAEKEAIGYAHTDVAQWLTAGWDLPAPLQLPMAFHHDPENTTGCEAMIALCHYADHLCYDLKLTIDETYAAPPLDPSVVRRLRLTEEDVEIVKLRLVNELDKVAIFCGIAEAA